MNKYIKKTGQALIGVSTLIAVVGIVGSIITTQFTSRIAAKDEIHEVELKVNTNEANIINMDEDIDEIKDDIKKLLKYYGIK